MIETDNLASRSNESPYRVLAWWDVDMHIGAYKKHKLTARPLRNLERILGHRVHVESRWRHRGLPDGVRKLEAFNYIDVADPALAAFFVLQQISGLSEWFSGSGYRPVTSRSEDENTDGDTICTFYWYELDQYEAYRHIRSGGVMLVLVEKLPVRTRNSSRPIVGIRQSRQPRYSYNVKIVIQFFCDNRQKLVEYHWPRLMKRYAFEPEDRVEFGPPSNNGKPNQICVSAMLADLTEYQAVAYCLARTERCRFKLGGPGEAIFQAERFPDHEPFDGMFSILLTRGQAQE
ncbi:hypothetical protein [Mesorhizobium sp. M0058]|uniref:hypothetical protein n=1 Tax=Mesorhizobium sp. M0058 TaxID=2956865 RepID=UPI00333AEC0F